MLTDDYQPKKKYHDLSYPNSQIKHKKLKKKISCAYPCIALVSYKHTSLKTTKSLPIILSVSIFSIRLDTFLRLINYGIIPNK